MTYAYGSSAWCDQLTGYTVTTASGSVTTSFSYDAMGNPTAAGAKTLTWHGKELAGYTEGTASVSYAYNHDRLRLRKTVNGSATDYCYNGTVLISQTSGQDKLLFSYGADGKAVSVRHIRTGSSASTNDYYYLRNAQGDIIAILNSSGTKVVEYTYDSWGKQLTCTGSLASTLGALNPLRYRGYVYDEETSWYYLQSRYYDPGIGRFISADVYLSTGQGVLGCNAYCYCGNNPVNNLDASGFISLPVTPYYETITMPEPDARQKTINYLKTFDDGTPQRHAIVNRMCELLGAPYSRQYDCKWFASEIVGVKNSEVQNILFERHVDKAYNKILSNPEKYHITVEIVPSFGDIIFFTCPDCKCDKNACKRICNIHHVGIYLGDDMMIDCGSNGVTVRSIYDVKADSHGEYVLFNYVTY